MSLGSERYISLQSLVDSWEKQSGELRQVIITNLADHEARGDLPSEAFRYSPTGGGGWADTGTLAQLVSQVRYSGYDWVRDEAAQALDEIVVYKGPLVDWCRRHSVRPPRALVGRLRWPFWPKDARQSPPTFEPSPEEKAAEQEVAKTADLQYRASLSLADLRGELRKTREFSWEKHRLGDEWTPPTDEEWGEIGAAWNQTAQKTREAVGAAANESLTDELERTLAERENLAKEIETWLPKQAEHAPREQHDVTVAPESKCRRWLDAQRIAGQTEAGIPRRGRETFRRRPQRL